MIDRDTDQGAEEREQAEPTTALREIISDSLQTAYALGVEDASAYERGGGRRGLDANIPLAEIKTSLEESVASLLVVPAAWIEEWPTENDSWWWLFARVWGDKEPQLYPVKVRMGANSSVYIASGHFLYRSDIEGPAWWIKIEIPPPPTGGA